MKAEDFLIQLMEKNNFKEKFWSAFNETHEGRIFSKINNDEMNRLKLYHFFNTGEIVDDIMELNR